MSKQVEKAENKVPYHIIVRASKGDKEALGIVLEHYSSYIDHCPQKAKAAGDDVPVVMMILALAARHRAERPAISMEGG